MKFAGNAGTNLSNTAEFRIARQLITWLEQDSQRMALLRAVSELGLPQGMLAAGCIRNLVWDKLHQKTSPLTDIDVIFFAPEALNKDLENEAASRLARQFPDLDWDAKNQARMHLKHGDRPYHDCADAMSFWPEKETAIAAYLDSEAVLHLVAPFGLTSLMEGLISPNPRRCRSLFEARLAQKNWLAKWPNLVIQS